MKTKPKNETEETKNCIYSIPCKCRKKYIGETGRPLNTRITKHKCNTRMGEISKSKIAEHSRNEDHRIQWNKVEIMHKEEKRIIRKLKKSVFKRTTEQAISQPSIEVSYIWLPLLWNRKTECVI
jgi:hypothetical protein